MKPVPDYIPDGDEYKWPQLRDKYGFARDYIPDENSVVVAAEERKAKRGKKTEAAA